MTGCLPNCERAARRLCDADFLSVGRHRQEVGWGPCQAGGALPEVAEAITSRGPVAPPAEVSGPLPGPCGRRALCLAASVLGSWARRGRPTGWWPGWWPVGEAACGRFSCRPAACPVFCPSPFVRPPGVSVLLVAPSPLHTCLAHTADSRFPSFAKLDTSPLAFLSVRS